MHEYTILVTRWYSGVITYERFDALAPKTAKVMAMKTVEYPQRYSLVNSSLLPVSIQADLETYFNHQR
jgi:hypothetical protein